MGSYETRKRVCFQISQTQKQTGGSQGFTVVLSHATILEVCPTAVLYHARLQTNRPFQNISLCRRPSIIQVQSTACKSSHCFLIKGSPLRHWGGPGRGKLWQWNHNKNVGFKSDSDLALECYITLRVEQSSVRQGVRIMYICINVFYLQ